MEISPDEFEWDCADSCARRHVCTHSHTHICTRVCIYTSTVTNIIYMHYIQVVGLSAHLSQNPRPPFQKYIAVAAPLENSVAIHTHPQ